MNESIKKKKKKEKTKLSVTINHDILGDDTTILFPACVFASTEPTAPSSR